MKEILMKGDTLGKSIYQAAIEAGFDNCGIIFLDDMIPYETRLQERIEKVPESKAFYEGIYTNANIKKCYPWAKSLVICTVWYGKYRYPKNLQNKYAKGFFLSYESDKSTELYKQTQSLNTWFDKQGIRWSNKKIYGLRYAAMQAGLGIIRRNNFFYDEKGSWLELVGFVIDQECRLYQNKQLRPCSPNCNLCIKNCPTRSLFAPYTMNPFKCISYCTTFGKGNIPKDVEENSFSTWIVGCDRCQDVCPYNRNDWDEDEDFPNLEELVPLLEPEILLKLSDEQLRNLIIPKTVGHIDTKDVETLRKNAIRFLKIQNKIH